jgi:hypothetical protein
MIGWRPTSSNFPVITHRFCLGHQTSPNCCFGEHGNPFPMKPADPCDRGIANRPENCGGSSPWKRGWSHAEGTGAWKAGVAPGDIVPKLFCRRRFVDAASPLLYVINDTINPQQRY